MANLWTGEVDTQNTYQDLATLSSLTFTADNIYGIQIDGVAYIREGFIGKGSLIKDLSPVKWKAGTDTMYICTVGKATVNILE